MLFFEIRFQFSLGQAHCDIADTVVFVCVIACPSTVDGNEPRERAVIDHPHGKITAAVSEMPAVQDPLCGIPLCSGDDRVVMARLVIAVLLPGVLH